MVGQTVNLAYEVYGDTTASGPLIILHGLFASSRNWRVQAQNLAAKHRVWVLDLRNHGRSPHHPQMDYPVLAGDVLAFMARQGLAKASLLGHSMGGKIAMWLALNYPEAVDKLVVADSAPVSYPHCFDGLVAALKALPLSELRSRKQAEALLLETIPDKAYRQFLLQNLVLQENRYQWRIHLDFFKTAAPAIAAFPDASALRPFVGKALFLAGADSGYVQAKDVRPLFPDADLRYLKQAGHWLHVQQPEAFTQQVESFLAAGEGATEA